MKTTATSQNMKLIVLLILVIGLNACTQTQSKVEQSQAPSLKKAYEGKFYIGAALDSAQIVGLDTLSLITVKEHFNSIVAENCMKSEVIQPKQGVFNFELADKFVAFGEANNMFIVGHCLVWHAQSPAWIFVDAAGNDVLRDTLIERMHTHINTLVSRYKGRVKGWDVVNEAILDDAGLRESKWFKIIGPDYIELAFKFANEADPQAELYYNDYNLYKPHKRDEAVKLIKSLKEKGIKINGIGEQAHYGLDMNVFNDIEASILAFSAQGVSVMITELDVSVLPFPAGELTAEVTLSFESDPAYDPYPNELPDSMQQQLTSFYLNLFNIYNKHSDKISRVTFWGVNDNQTWRNYWPINGRTDYPLFFDKNNKPKPVLFEVVKLVQ